jgi:hypothetical protein
MEISKIVGVAPQLRTTENEVTPVAVSPPHYKSNAGMPPSDAVVCELCLGRFAVC